MAGTAFAMVRRSYQQQYLMNGKLRKIEMMRGFAAVYVMVVHVLLRFVGQGSLLGLPLRFGQEAVMLFLLISGFVVLYSTERQKPDFPTYFGRRWTRIYPIFLLAICVVAFDVVIFRSQRISGRDLFGNLLMLQDFSYGKPGVWFPAFGGNAPLWSLAYEWWFYMLFYPIWRFVPVHQQRHVAVAISLAGLVGYALYPNQLSLYLAYFILWWTGAEFARQYLAEGKVTFRYQRSSLLVLAAFVFLVPALLISRHNWSGSLGFGLYPILQIRHFVACLAIVLGALLWQRLKWRGFDIIFGIFIWFAPISYGLYVLHYPIIVSGSFFKSIPAPWSLPFSVVAALVAAWFAEVPFQRAFQRLSSNLFPKRMIQLPTPNVTLSQSPPRPDLA